MVESSLVAVALLAFVGWLLLWWHQRSRAWLPRELRHGVLAYSEKLFRADGPIVLTAKVDRAYRLGGGVLVLVELKTRSVSRPYRSDVIELSAQRVAIMKQTGETVARHGYVVVQTGGGRRTAHKVTLLGDAEVKALIDRRQAVLAGTVQPLRTCAPNLCFGCGFAKECTDARFSEREPINIGQSESS